MAFRSETPCTLISYFLSLYATVPILKAAIIWYVDIGCQGVSAIQSWKNAFFQSRKMANVQFYLLLSVVTMWFISLA